MAKGKATPSERDIEALAADENSPLLGGESGSHGTMRSTISAASTYTSSLSSDSSVTATDADNDNAIYAAPAKESQGKQNIAAMLCLLLIVLLYVFVLGDYLNCTFVSNADSSIVNATYPIMSSEFHALSHASLLSTSYLLSTCASQPLLAKLSDIYGRKPVLLFSYALFTLGTVYCGLANSFATVIAARAIAGIGGAGLSVVNGILVQDLVPMRDIGMWRGISNVASTTGRAAGGPLGGWLSDVVGWRWGFLGQGPVMALAFVLVAWNLKVPSDARLCLDDRGPTKTAKAGLVAKLKRIDFGGAAMLMCGIVLLILAMELPNNGAAWTSPLFLGCVAASAVIGTLFLMFESSCPAEPIYPPRLLKKRSVWTSYICLASALGGQVAMMFTVPLYFQVVTNATAGEAGAHLVPAVLANTVGCLASGWYMQKTGRYKTLTIIGGLLASSASVLMMLTWKGEAQMGWWKSLAVVPGGLGCGIVIGTTFIIAMSDLKPKDMAVSTGGLYLMSNIGCVVGVSVVSSIQNGRVRALLAEALPGEEGRRVIDGVMRDLSFMRGLDDRLKKVVVGAYAESFTRAHAFSLAGSVLCFVVGFLIPDETL